MKLQILIATLGAGVLLHAASPAETDALRELYNQTGGSHWTHSENWLSGDPCAYGNEWYGVTCDFYGNVTELDLHGNNLAGTLPNELGNLTNLVTLYLDQNHLEGTIPATIGNLGDNLEELLLGHNWLTGSIPSQIGNLRYLTDLELNDNRLSGDIPAELLHLNDLETLWLFNNCNLQTNDPDLIDMIDDVARQDGGYQRILDTNGNCAGTVSPPPGGSGPSASSVTVPTLSEWGRIVLAANFLFLSSMVLGRRRKTSLR